MQCGSGARPEWAGKRLVALKKMKKKWEGGWDECKKLKELEVRPLVAFFLHPVPFSYSTHTVSSHHSSSFLHRTPV